MNTHLFSVALVGIGMIFFGKGAEIVLSEGQSYDCSVMWPCAVEPGLPPEVPEPSNEGQPLITPVMAATGSVSVGSSVGGVLMVP